MRGNVKQTIEVRMRGLEAMLDKHCQFNGYSWRDNRDHLAQWLTFKEFVGKGVTPTVHDAARWAVDLTRQWVDTKHNQQKRDKRNVR